LIKIPIDFSTEASIVPDTQRLVNLLVSSNLRIPPPADPTLPPSPLWGFWSPTPELALSSVSATTSIPPSY